MASLEVSVGVPTLRIKDGPTFVTTGGLRVVDVWSKQQETQLSITFKSLFPIWGLEPGKIYDIEVVFPPDSHGQEKIWEGPAELLPYRAMYEENYVTYSEFTFTTPKKLMKESS